MVKMRRSSGRRMALWCRPCGLLPSRLESARARGSTKARNLLIKTTEREHSSSVYDYSPTETLTGISVELCPNGNRLWCPESRFADTVTCRSRKSQSVRAAIQAGSASSWPANRRQLHAEHGLKPRGLKAEVQATSTREQRHDAPLVQTRRIHCLWHVGIAHLYTDHRSQLRIDPSVCLQMADEARKLGRHRIAVAIFVRVAQRRSFLDLGFNSVAFRHRQC